MRFNTSGERTCGDLDALLLFISICIGIELRPFGLKRDEVTRKCLLFSFVCIVTRCLECMVVIVVGTLVHNYV
jgi:hypothetical protein